MSIRYTISQTVTGGEHLTIEVLQDNPVTGKRDFENQGDMLQEALQAEKLIDLRSAEMNTRMLEAYGLLSTRYFPPQALHRVTSILDILAGRVTAHVIKSRWESEIEENQDLEEGRLAAQNGVNHAAVGE